MLDSSYKLFKSSRYLTNSLVLATVSSIYAITIQGISSPPCTNGDRRYLVLDNFVVTIAPRSKLILLLERSTWANAPLSYNRRHGMKFQISRMDFRTYDDILITLLLLSSTPFCRHGSLHFENHRRSRRKSRVKI